MAKKLYAYSPEGVAIVGTNEKLYGTAIAIVSKSPATGEIEVEHQGETTIDWDAGETVRLLNGEEVPKDTPGAEMTYVDEEGKVWPESQLVWEETIPDGVDDDPEEAGDDGEG